MSRYYFEQDFDLNYTYSADAVPSADAPAIYIFEDKPTRSNAGDGTGSIQTISSWSTADQANTKTASITAITDPEPTSEKRVQNYYVAFNYTLETSGTSITDVQEIFIERPHGDIKSIKVTASDIVSVYPHITQYLNESEIAEYIKLAIKSVEIDLQKAGYYDLTLITNQDVLYLPIAYKAISEASLAQFKDLGDQHHERARIFEDKYQEKMMGLKLDYDSDGDGDGDISISTKMNFMYNIR